METLIAAIGVILSTLMDLPSYHSSITDVKKSKLAKVLAQFIDELDKVIRRG